MIALNSIQTSRRLAMVTLSCASLLLTHRVDAQATLPDTIGLRDAVSRAQTALASLRATWGIDGSDVRWILTDRRSHVSTEGSGGGLRLDPITLPAGTVMANHAVDWSGRRFAMVLLPLPSDAQERMSLLVHEAMHTFQPEQLPRAANTEAGEGGELMAGDTARTWLFLELRALASAMTSQGAAQRRAAHDALVFRARRDAMALPRERERLDGLDVSEGIPEYTGLRLSGLSADSLAARLRRAPASAVSWVRASGYWTGPAYGYALDQLAGVRWRAEARNGRQLPMLLADAVGAASTSESDAARWARYAGDSLWRVERTRAEIRKRRVDSLRATFVAGRVLRLVPGSMQVAFDPNGQVSLGTDGTVMRGFRWAGADGSELVAPEGALVSPRWDWVQVPLGAVSPPDGVLDQPLVVQGEGWKLTLPAGWRVTHVEGRVEVRPSR